MPCGRGVRGGGGHGGVRAVLCVGWGRGLALGEGIGTGPWLPGAARGWLLQVGTATTFLEACKQDRPEAVAACGCQASTITAPRALPPAALSCSPHSCPLPPSPSPPPPPPPLAPPLLPARLHRPSAVAGPRGIHAVRCCYCRRRRRPCGCCPGAGRPCGVVCDGGIGAARPQVSPWGVLWRAGGALMMMGRGVVSLAPRHARRWPVAV